MVYKLKHNLITPKKVQVGNNQKAKFLILDALFHNVKVLTERASLDLCGDEKYYPFAYFYDIGSSINSRVHNTPVILKSGNTNVVDYHHTCIPRVFIYHHKHQTIVEVCDNTNVESRTRSVVKYIINNIMST